MAGKILIEILDNSGEITEESQDEFMKKDH